jgi:antitoxin HicB
MKRTVEAYMTLPYTIELTPDDGSYFVKVKELDGCMSVGATMIDALTMIDDAMREWIAVAIEQGIDIPQPETLREDRYSGKFPLRLPKSLHRKLSQAAERDHVSLNQYLVMLLSETHALHQVKTMLAVTQGHPRLVSVDQVMAIREEELSDLWQPGSQSGATAARKLTGTGKTRKRS